MPTREKYFKVNRNILRRRTQAALKRIKKDLCLIASIWAEADPGMDSCCTEALRALEADVGEQLTSSLEYLDEEVEI